MTESSSAGNPDGAALPADHPLGPAVPIPPREKEAARVGSTGNGRSAPAPATPAGGGSGQGDGTPGEDGPDDDGRPTADRRESVLDPAAGSAGQEASSIREEQGTSGAGLVPAAYNGDGSPEDPAENRHPEDAAAEPDGWDSDRSSP
ncbi:hypothetical protein GM708_13985 [Vibrio cholerae]|nr:hypothetical protein [Vibrio cholerae]